MTDETVLRLERLIPATPEDVFDAWTQPEIMTQWWGPEGFRTPSPEVDLRAGGRYRTVMIASDGAEFIASGVFREIQRPRRLVFTWAFEKEGERGHETEITVTFDAAPGGTKLVFLQQRFETTEACQRHSHGWNSMFNRLEHLHGQRETVHGGR
jgi:uncharacterized protein YndB with AHSA1/START domain